MLTEGLGRDLCSIDQLFAVRSPQKASQPLSAVAGDQRTVKELPSLPGSAELFLSAMLSVGVWQAVRKTRHVHFADLPEWYHPDAPQQIGHSHAFDPHLGYDVLPVCRFDIPIGDEQPVSYRFQREVRSPCESQFFLPASAPRGPPSLS